MAVMDVDLLLGIEQALLLPLIILFYARCSCHQLQVCGGRSPFISRAGGSNLGLVGQNVHCRRQCVEARSADQSSTRSAKFFFRVIFQLPGWALVAPSCFALHCHCSLVSLQSVTVSLSTWKGNVRCAGSPRLLATSTSFSLLLFHFLAPPLSKSHVVLVSTYNQFVVRAYSTSIVLNKRPDNVSSRHFKFCCNATGLVNRLSLEPGPQYVAMYPQRRTLSAA